MRSSIRLRRVILLRSDIRLATSDMPTWSALRGAMGKGRWNNKLQFIGEFNNSNIFKYFHDYVIF